MPKWSDYKEAARSRGNLALEVYVVESTPVVEPKELQATLPAHLDYQKKMESAGKLAFAGPLSDETGAEMNGTGMIVYRAASLDEARQFANADPMHVEGKRTYKIRRWLINEGSFNLSVALSGQSVVFS
ncbi:MAG: YciI family protein [Alphaproteobacteria bacterium]